VDDWERAYTAGMNPKPIAETFDVHADRLSMRYLRLVAVMEHASGPGAGERGPDADGRAA
jgi:hypothetical protein